MKNTNNLKCSALEAMLHQHHLDNEHEMILNARSYGDRNIPLPIGDILGTYFEEHHLKSQQLIDKVNSELQYQSTCHKVAVERENVVEKIRRLRNEIDDIQRKFRQVNSELKSLPTCISKAKLFIIYGLLCIVSLFDGILSIPVFEIWGFNLVESIIAGLLFSVVIASTAHVSKRLINLGKTTVQRKVIALSILIFMTMLFAYMAYARAEYLSNNIVDDKNSPLMEFSPIPFVLISLLLFVVAVAICFFYMPSKEEKKISKMKFDLLENQNALSNEINNKKDQIDQVNQEFTNLKELCSSILVTGCMLEEQIINKAKTGFVLWKRENLMHRQDNLKPDCFNDQYPFKHTTYFHSIKNLGNENIGK